MNKLEDIPQETLEQINLIDIPQEAFEQLKDCTTAEEVLSLAQQYDVPLTREVAEAVIGEDPADLQMNFGCGKKEKVKPVRCCDDCKWKTGEDSTGNYYQCTQVNGTGIGKWHTFYQNCIHWEAKN